MANWWLPAWSPNPLAREHLRRFLAWFPRKDSDRQRERERERERERAKYEKSKRESRGGTQRVESINKSTIYWIVEARAFSIDLESPMQRWWRVVQWNVTTKSGKNGFLFWKNSVAGESLHQRFKIGISQTRANSSSKPLLTFLTTLSRDVNKILHYDQRSASAKLI